MADKRFRLYPLTAPPGAAVAPILEERLEINVWQDAEAVVRDVDGDGVEDLLLLAPPGMGDGRLAVWTFRRRAGGGFEPPEKSVRGLEGASFGTEHDLTGDGVSDLVLLNGKSAAVYPGGSGPGDFAEV
ncbi:MAG: VCBS repeat-containing protein, partial [Thermoanaerobaculia bacterium]|nr:VCBS repeat-containing protein [Thermoanaerobaculia bacterium]